MFGARAETRPDVAIAKLGTEPPADGAEVRACGFLRLALETDALVERPADTSPAANVASGPVAWVNLRGVPKVWERCQAKYVCIDGTFRRADPGYINKPAGIFDITYLGEAPFDDEPEANPYLEPFDAAAAEAGIRAVKLSGCRRDRSAPISDVIHIVVEPDGVVSEAHLVGAGATAIGGCVASQFRRLKLAPFHGRRVEVSQPIMY